MHDSQTVNVLGAAALSIGQLVGDSSAATARVSRSGAAALAVILQAGALSVTELGRRIGLSQPAAARMVDTLERAELVRRRAAGRRALVALTGSGRTVARRVLRERSARIGELLDGLSAEEQRTLGELLGKVMHNVYRQVPSADVICRLCDRRECVQVRPRCPVGVAAGEEPDG